MAPLIAWVAAFVTGALAVGFGLGRLSRRPRSNPAEGPLALVTDMTVGEGHRAPDPGALAASLLGLVRHHCDALGAALLSETGGEWQVAAASPGARLSKGRTAPLREGLPGLALESSREVVADPVQRASLPFLDGAGGAVAVALIPIARRGGRSGFLACWRQAGRPFSAPEQAQLGRCAQLLAGWEAYAAHARRLEGARGRQERIVRGLERMLKESDPLEMAGLALDALFDLLPARAGYAVLSSEQTRYHALVTKPFDTPPGFDHLGRATWSYYVMTKGETPLYLEGAAGRETAMPLLCAGEPFPTEGRIAYLHPLRGTGEALGVVGLVGREECPFEESDREAASFLLGQTGALIELALVNRQNAELAMKDSLTGLFNRRHFDERLRLELRRAQREGTPVGLLLCDLDHFKRVNDGYGHPAGDAVLREAARRIGEAVRDVDVVCRYGGEEFAVVLPACALEEAGQVAERVRRSVSALPIPLDGATALPITVSVGVSAFPSPVNNALELARAADGALYRAKTRGRDRVESGGG